ncbi:hypothetical protein DDZ18_12630 [Marinicauda salina]|uniref:Uncharacterized protein n=1 Tax=Marinicauda salina TaxID=2135793 RepID=A0A2U2BRI7_9PROT|nr:hypothetical protein DDZ18_12630 [Marinicauda salina]
MRNITGYSVIDDRHVLLNSGASRHFLITTSTRCSGLRFGIQIGASFDDNERLCPPLVEHLVTDDGWRCPIESIEPVADIDAARELIEQRSADENSED